MEEACAPKPCLEFSTKVQIANESFQIVLAQKSENLLIKINQMNSVPPTSYESEFSKKELDRTSKYFKMFDDINELFPEIQNKFEKNEYIIKKGENSLLIYFNISIKNIPDFSLTIKKSNISINSTVDALCELVNKVLADNKNMQKEIKELKNKITNLENDIKELKQTKLKELKEEKEKNNIIDSDILKNKEDKIMVCNWIKQNTKFKFNLLYKVSRDGDRISTFAEKVKGKAPTLILIKSKAGYKFGGYTTVEWNMTGNYTYKEDKFAFIFSINNKQKFNLKKGGERYAICGDPNHFAFGGGHNLTIWDNCTSSDNSKDYSYNHTYDTTQNYELTGGSQSFYVEELEVYQVIFD